MNVCNTKSVAGAAEQGQTYMTRKQAAGLQGIVRKRVIDPESNSGMRQAFHSFKNYATHVERSPGRSYLP